MNPPDEPNEGTPCWSHRFTSSLPGDPSSDPRPRQVLASCYSRVTPTPVAHAHMLAVSQEMAGLLPPSLRDSLRDAGSEEAWWAGNGFPHSQVSRVEVRHAEASHVKVPPSGSPSGTPREDPSRHSLPGSDPHAACYGGHQFGSWAGQLGDGRAITLGELCLSGPDRVAEAEKACWWPRHGEKAYLEVQLKGAGPTPYARSADGRAVLRSSVREFLCSEAMHHLGIPTTRALSLAGTGEGVLRDMLYSGHPAYEPGAVVCRIAPSFLRFGSFELLAMRRDHQTLRLLFDYVMHNLFAETLKGLGQDNGITSQCIALLRAVLERSVPLVTKWMSVGFVHGVMNTDNMSLLGLTIDYGPFGFLEPFDPSWTPNTTDAAMGRYRMGQQPQVMLWNLARFAEALMPLMIDDGKLAAKEAASLLEKELDRFAPLYRQAQYESSMRKLGLWQGDVVSAERQEEHEQLWLDWMAAMGEARLDWTRTFRALSEGVSEAKDLRANSYAAQTGSGAEMPGLHAVQAVLDRIARVASQAGRDPAERFASMQAVNPVYVLRNYLAQLAIDDAAKGDLHRLHETLDVLRRPFVRQQGRDAYAAMRPAWAEHKPGCAMLSCSS